MIENIDVELVQKYVTRTKFEYEDSVKETVLEKVPRVYVFVSRDE